MRLLTDVLQLKASEDPILYSNRVLALIEDLPSRLKSPSLLKRLVRSSKNYDDGRPRDQRGPLCPLHHKLNASIIHKLFTLLALEVGRHLNTLARQHESMNDSEQETILRLRALHAIWYQADQFEIFFYQKASDTKWTYQGNKCAACTVSRIAGDRQAILDLLCAVTSRSAYSARRQKPRLHAWLMAWLGHHQEQEGIVARQSFKSLLYKSEVRALGLRERRQSVAESRKQVRASAQTSTLTPQPKHQQVGLRDTLDEGRIISLYIDDEDAGLEKVDLHAALLSTPHLPNMNQFRRDQAQRSRLNVDEPSQLDQSRNNNFETQRRRHAPSVRSRSIYTQNHSDNLSGAPSTRSASPPNSWPEYLQPRTDWFSSEQAAASYTNVLKANNPFASRTTLSHSPPNPTKHLFPQPNQSTASIYTDCSTDDRDSLASFARFVPRSSPPTTPPSALQHQTQHHHESSSLPSLSLREIHPALRPTQHSPTPPHQIPQRSTSTRTRTHHHPSPQASPPKRSHTTRTHKRRREPPRADTNLPGSTAVASRAQTRHHRDVAADNPADLSHPHRQQERSGRQAERPAQTQDDRTSTATRFSRSWRDEVDNSPENRFYRERREHERKKAWRRLTGEGE